LPDNGEPTWLSVEDVVAIHDDIVAIYGSHGLINQSYIESAVFAPRQLHNYSSGGVDLFDLAAAYLYHIAMAHGFVDANKRTAYGSALVFLGLNGTNLLLPANIIGLAAATVAIVKHETSKDSVAELLRRMPRRDGGFE
jgi:death on curing protein